MRTPDSWLRPRWPAPPNVRAVFTSREGGISEAPFGSLNLGDHVGDDPIAVATNRQCLAEAIGARPVFMRQVHGRTVADLDDPPEGEVVADACLVARPGLAATIMVADCLPVLLTDTEGRAVAAAHAGWRGLAGQDGQGVLEATVAALRLRVGAQAALLAWLGPCIGPQAFEVGGEVRDAFCVTDPGAAACFTPGSPDPVPRKWWADLPALARRRLHWLGIDAVHGNDGSAGWCTVAQSSVFFSHRRDAVRLGGTGRMAACIWRG